MNKMSIFLLACLAVYLFSCSAEEEPQPDQAKQPVREKPEKPVIPEKQYDPNARFPIQVDGKWGYIDRMGKVVIEPKYEIVGKFCDGVALVFDKGEQLYIDRTGEIVTDSQFGTASNFSDGLACVILQNENRYGFIDKTGKLAIEPQFVDVWDFSDTVQ